MRVTLKGHESFYGVGDIVRLFFDEPKENREEGFVELLNMMKEVLNIRHLRLNIFSTNLSTKER